MNDVPHQIFGLLVGEENTEINNELRVPLQVLVDVFKHMKEEGVQYDEADLRVRIRVLNHAPIVLSPLLESAFQLCG